MRVCALDESFFTGGVDAVNGARVQIVMIARELMARGHEVFALSAWDLGNSRDAPLEVEGIPVFSFRRSARLPFLGALAASRAMRRLAPDVVYVRGRTYLAGVAAWERLRRHTGFVWASNAEEGCERWKHLTHLWKGPRPFMRKLLRTPPDMIADLITDLGISRADQHVCQTLHQCERLLAVHRREGIVVRSLQVAPPMLPAKRVPPLVVWIGRVSPERLPEAFVDLARSLVDVDLDFALIGPAANAPYLERVLRPSVGLDRFRYVGEVHLSESWEWIAKASILVNTSPVEGISNALVQAWHCGTPTVTLSFDPDGIIERNAVGFRCGDSEALARDVRRLLAEAELRETMGKRALALARCEFSGETVGAAYEDLMSRAIVGATA